MDPDEVRRMAERLIAPLGGEPLPSGEAPFGSEFEGFAGGVAVAVPAPVAAAESPQVQRQVQAVPGAEAGWRPGDAPSGLDAAGAGSAEVPRGPFLQRVQRFRDWLHEQFGARGVFLLDKDGRVIFDDGVNLKLQALARNLALASRAAAGAGNVHFKIGAEATLEVIPVDTRYGLMVLGLVVGQAIAPRGVALIVEGLERAAMPPDGRAER